MPPPLALTKSRVLRRCTEQHGARLLQVPLDPGRCFVADRDDALLVALARAGEIRRVQVDIGRPQRHQFRDAHPGCVQQLDDRAVTKASRRRHVGLCDEAIDVLDGQVSRQDLPRTRWTKILRRVHAQAAVDHAETDRSPGNRPRRARPIAASALQTSGPAPVPRDLAESTARHSARGRRRTPPARSSRAHSSRSSSRRGDARR